MKKPKPFEFPPADKWITWVLFLKAYKAVVERVDKELRKGSPLSLAEFEILHMVSIADGRIRFIDLAKVTLLSQSRISRQIDSLQQKGFLLREVTDADRRATYAVMTPAGAQAYDDALQPFLRSYHLDFAELIGDEQAPQFTQVLDVLLQDPDYKDKVNAIMEGTHEVKGAPPKPKRAETGRARKVVR